MKNTAPMRSLQFYISTALAAICLVLAVWTIFASSANQRLQLELNKQQQTLQEQQEQINAGNLINQKIGPSLLQDMAIVSVEDKEMKDLLAKHGYTVNVQATPAPGSDKDASKPATPTSE